MSEPKNQWSERGRATSVANADALGRPSADAARMTVARALDTCTAGDSPKKFGSVKRNASAIVSPISAYFQTGYRFTYLMDLIVPLGSRVCTADFCTLTSVLAAISTVA